jgi:hypothetical protein
VAADFERWASTEPDPHKAAAAWRDWRGRLARRRWSGKKLLRRRSVRDGLSLDIRQSLDDDDHAPGRGGYVASITPVRGQYDQHLLQRLLSRKCELLERLSAVRV